MSGRIAFDRVAAAALTNWRAVVPVLLPDGALIGPEWVSINPVRADKRPGSLKVNTRTGKWCEFATGDKGGDLVSLTAYITGLSQRDAAIRLAESLGVNPFI